MNKTFLRLAAATALVMTLPACSSNPKVEEPAYTPAPEAARPAPLELSSSTRGPVLTIDDVQFDFEEATLRSEAGAVVAQAAAWLRDNPDRRAVIEGHTDHVGDAAYNVWLSNLRAESVRDGLLANGIDPARIETGGLGETRPVASNDTSAGRQANRRVEIVFARDGRSL